MGRQEDPTQRDEEGRVEQKKREKKEKKGKRKTILVKDFSKN